MNKKTSWGAKTIEPVLQIKETQAKQNYYENRVRVITMIAGQPPQIFSKKGGRGDTPFYGICDPRASKAKEW